MAKPTFKEMLKDPKAMAVLWFGSGLSPKFPGTAGTIGALPFAVFIHYFFGPIVLLIAGLVLFALGVTWCNDYMKKYDRPDDPGEAVIDEVAAVWMVLAFAPLDFAHYYIGFALFRLFDIWKPWPASTVDRYMKGGLGVMLDDVVAAGYAIILGAVLYALYDYGYGVSIL